MNGLFHVFLSRPFLRDGGVLCDVEGVIWGGGWGGGGGGQCYCFASYARVQSRTVVQACCGFLFSIEQQPAILFML